MATTPWRTLSTVVVTGSGSGWTPNTGTILSCLQAADDQHDYASFEIAGQTSQRLRCTGFGFSADILSGDTVQGVELRIKRRSWTDSASRTRDHVVQLWGGSASVGANKAATDEWPVNPSTYVTYGGSTDGWDAGLTAEVVRSANFGVDVAAYFIGGSGGNRPGIDHIEMRVHYTSGPDTTAPTITSAASINAIAGSPRSHALTADEPVTWTKVGGANAAIFTVTGSTLAMEPQATGAYTVVVRATDGSSNWTEQTITVTVLTAAAGWSPADLSSKPRNWYRADIIAAANGANIDTWPDTGLAGNTLLSSSQKPTLVTSAYNGQSAVRRTSTAQSLVSGASMSISGAQPRTVFIVAKKTSNSPTSANIMGWGAEATGQGFDPMWFGANNEFMAHCYGGGFDTIGGGSGANAQQTDTTNLHVMAVRYSSPTINTWINGQAMDQFSMALNTGVSTLKVGRGSFAGFDGQPGTVDVCEILIFDYAMVQADYQKVEGYLAHRYGSAGLLPAGHPYKTAPPAGVTPTRRPPRHAFWL